MTGLASLADALILASQIEGKEGKSEAEDAVIALRNEIDVLTEHNAYLKKAVDGSGDAIAKQFAELAQEFAKASRDRARLGADVMRLQETVDRYKRLQLAMQDTINRLYSVE